MIDPQRLQAIFEQIQAIEVASERMAAIERECAGDEALQQAVSDLLRQSDEKAQHAVTVTHAPTPTAQLERSPARRQRELPQINDRYRVVSIIGEGGMGSVWLAEQLKPVKRMVALKLIKVGLDQEAVLMRFEAERQALAMMDHPSIAKILDGGSTVDGRPFFVMELVNGEPLTNYCDSHQLSIDDRLDLFMQICAAVQHAHQKGVIHRDLKPSNILVAEHDGKPLPKVIDFGLAKALHEGAVLTEEVLQTAFGAVLGTPLYMAPEQINVQSPDVDTRSDVYALGVILYELLTGSTPIDRRELQKAAWDEVCRLIREQDPPRPSQRIAMDDKQQSIAVERRSDPGRLRRAIAGDLDWIVMKALEKDRDRRYDMPSDFSRDIHHFRAHEPVDASPPSAVYRLRKFVRRHRAPVAAGAVVLLGIVVGLIGATWGMGRARQAESGLRVALKNEETATSQAKAAKQEAEQRGAALKRQLSAQYVQNGTAALQEWDNPLALLWFVKALELDEGDPTREPAHRLRIANTWDALPPLTHQFFHAAPVADVSFSHQGDRVITASYDGTARIWNLVDNKPVGEPLQHAGYVLRAKFSPDDELVATACADGTVQVWNSRTGKPAAEPFVHRSSVSDLEFSPDGKKLLTAVGHPWGWFVMPAGVKVPQPPKRPDRPLAALWDLTTQQATPLELAGEEDPFVAVFSGDGSRVATAGANRYSLVVCDSTTGKQVSPPLKHNSQPRFAALSFDGKFAATTDYHSIGRLYEVDSGEIIGAWADSGEVKFAPSGDGVFIAGWRNLDGQLRQGSALPQARSVRIAEMSAQALTWRDGRLSWTDSSLPAERADHLFTSGLLATAALSKDGQRAAAACDGNVARVWTRTPPSAQRSASFQQEAAVWTARYSATGDAVLTADIKGNVHLRNAQDSKLLFSPMNHSAHVYDASFSANGKLIATAGKDCTLRLWNAADGSQAHEPFVAKQPLRQAIFSPSGDTVFLCGDSGTSSAMAINPQDGTLRWGPVSLRDRANIAVSPDGRFVGATNDQGQAILLHADTGKRIPTAGQHDYASRAPSFSPDSSLFATCGSDATICFWSTSTGQQTQLIHTPAPIYFAASFAPDGKAFAAADSTGNIRVWNIATGAIISPTIVAGAGVQMLAFNPDGSALAAGLQNGEAAIWDSRTGELLAPAWHFDKSVMQVRFHPRGTKLLLASEDGRVQQSELSPDLRSVQRLKRLAEVQAAGKLDPRGSFLAFSPAELQALWNEIHNNNSPTLSAPPDKKEKSSE